MSRPCDLDGLVAALRRVIPAGEPAPLHVPRFAGREWDYVKDCLDSTFVSSVGPYVDRFERQIEAVLGGGHAVAVMNGTAALHVALMLAGVERDDEVLIPALTFIATANAVSYCSAIPHFVDSSALSLGLDPAALADYLDDIAERRDQRTINRLTGRRLAAVVPMHVFGHPVDMDGLAEVAARWSIPVVEDAAESLGSRYYGRAAGLLAPIAALSFNGNKIVTTGGGGAVVCSDPETARFAKHLTTTAKLPHRWGFQHDRVGYNYRLPNLNAALGCAQLEQLDGFIASKRRLAETYRAELANVAGQRFFAEPNHTESNYWLNAILLDRDDKAERDRVLAGLHDAQILARPAWDLIPDLPIYRNTPRMPLDTARRIERRLINLPSSAALGERM